MRLYSSVLAALLIALPFNATAQDLFDSGAATSAAAVAPKVTKLSDEATLLQFDIESSRWAGTAQVLGNWLLLDQKGNLYRSNGDAWERDVVVPESERAAQKGNQPDSNRLTNTALLSNGSVVFAGSAFPADNRISFDGRTWFKPKYNASGSTHLNSVAASPRGYFTQLAGGFFGADASYSTNWENWTRLISSSKISDTVGDDKGALLLADGIKYIVTTKGDIYASRIGENWRKEISNVSPGGVRDPMVTYGNAILAAAVTEFDHYKGVLARGVGDGKWISYNVVGGGKGYTGLTFDRGRFVAITAGTSDTTSSVLWTSTDALTWTRVATLPDYDGKPWHEGMSSKSFAAGFATVNARNYQTITSGPEGFLVPGPGGYALLYKTPALAEIESARDPIEWTAPSFSESIMFSNRKFRFVGGRYWASNGEDAFVLEDRAWKKVPLEGPKELISEIGELHGGVCIARVSGYHLKKADAKDWQWVEKKDLGALTFSGDRILSISNDDLQTTENGVDWEIQRWTALIKPWFDANDISEYVATADRVFALGSLGALFQSKDYKTWEQVISTDTNLKRSSAKRGLVVGDGRALYYMGYEKEYSFLEEPRPYGKVYWLEENGGWQSIPLPAENSILDYVGYRNGRFVALVSQLDGKEWFQSIHSTIDGKSWESHGWLDYTVKSAVMGDQGFYVVGTGGRAALVDLPAVPVASTASRFKPIADRAYSIPAIRTLVSDRSERNKLGEQAIKFAANGDKYYIDQAARMLNGEEKDTPYIRNPEQAEVYFKKGVEVGYEKSITGYASLLMDWIPSRKPEAIALLEGSANQFPSVAYMLAERYQKGDGVAANQQSVVTWLQKASDLGHATASVDLGYVKNFGSIDKNPSPEALFAVAKAQEQESSTFVVRNLKQSFINYWAAANAGHLVSIHRLVELIEGGSVPALSAEESANLVPAKPTDNDAALRLWVDKGVILKDPILLRYKGQLLSGGARGYAADVSSAFAHIKEASDLNDLEAIKLMGEAYARGVGVPVDTEQAKVWFRKAADAGHKEAAKRIEELDAIAARSSALPPQDGKVDGLAPAVFAALKTIQEAEGSEVGEAQLKALFVALWSDADYDSTEEDLSQEISALAAGGSIAISDTSGKSLGFTKTLAAAVTPGFSSFFQVPFNANDNQFVVKSWSLTQTGGPLLFFARKAKAEGNATLANQYTMMLAQTAMEAGQKDGVFSSNPANFIAQVDDFAARAMSLDDAESVEFRAIAYSACQMVGQRVGGRWDSFFSKLKP